MSRTNRKILSGGKDYASRRSKEFGVPDVEFNKDDRLNYLTGFHKRKVQRQKKAQEFQKEQDRLAKIEHRKEIREERRKRTSEGMKQFRESLELDKEITENYRDEDEKNEELKTNSDSDSDSDSNPNMDSADAEEWYGFEQKSILKSSYPGAEVSIETLAPKNDLELLAKANNVRLEKSDRILKQSILRAGKYAKFVGMADAPKRKKIKKFRYLTKGERKLNQLRCGKGKKRK